MWLPDFSNHYCECFVQAEIARQQAELAQRAEEVRRSEASAALLQLATGCAL